MNINKISKNITKLLHQVSYDPLKVKKDEPIIKTIKKTIRTRNGRKIEAEIENVFFQTKCFNTRGEYPYHINTKKINDEHYEVYFKLPYGLSYKTVIEKTRFFSDGLIAQVNIEQRKGLLMVEVIKGIIPEIYNYDFEYGKHIDKIIPIPIGVSVNKMVVVIDLVKIPHLMLGGVTRSGKSILLTGICDALMQNSNVKLFVIDMAMTDFIHLKDYCPFGYDLDSAEMILEYLMKEVERRRYFLVKNNCVNLIKYNEKNPEDKLEYIVLVVDEFAFTSPRKSDDKYTKKRRQRFQSIFADLGMMSAKTGIHLIIAMQRPSKELIPMEVKSNFSGVISFKCVNFGTSMVLLGNTDAYYLPNVKGRMLFQLGSRQMELQAMLLEQEEAIKRLKKYKLNENSVNTIDGVKKGDDASYEMAEFEYQSKRLLPR